VSDCDHFYTGREAHVCDLIGEWLARVLRMPQVLTASA
jgi:hypothetical protein